MSTRSRDEGTAAPGDADASVLLWFEHAPMHLGVAELDAEGKVTFVVANEALTRFMELATGAPRGAEPQRLAPLEPDALWRSKYREAKATGKSVAVELRGMAEDPAALFAISVTYLGESLTGASRFGLVGWDISEQRRVEEQLSSVLQSAPGFILTLDRNYKILSIHGPFGAMETWIGVDMLSGLPPEQCPSIRALLERVLRTGEVAQYESSSPEKATKPLAWYSSTVGPLRRDGEIVGLTIVSTEITRGKKLEQEARAAAERARASAAEIARKNELLEREIEERRRTEALLRQQQEKIRALSTPLLQVWDGVLALPVVGALDEERATLLMEKLLAEVVRARICVAILDLTGATGVDAATAGHLFRIARATRLLGSRCVLSGISPEIAQTMTAAGVSAEGFATFGSLKDALQHALSRPSAARTSPR